MDVSLERVAYRDKDVLAQLLQLYLYDFTEFEPRELDDRGRFSYRYLEEYWAPAGGEARHAFFIRADSSLAGFALVRVVNGVNVMSEFFVMRAHRRAGVGSEAAKLVFTELPGDWLVHQIATNLPAQAFWRRVIGRFTNGQYTEETVDGLTQRFSV